jgi:hypothetical protein
MSEIATQKPDYGNWVSMRLLYLPGAITIVLVGLSFWLPGLAVVAAIFFLCFAYFAYARYRFSSQGGDVQARIQALAACRRAHQKSPLGWRFSVLLGRSPGMETRPTFTPTSC